jgi:hypothetical protein
MAITLDKLDSAFASFELKTAAGQALTIDGSGFITSNINGTVTVSATQLDIDDLSSANDNVEIKTAAGQALDIDGSGYLTVNGNGNFTVVDGGGSLTVDAVDLDIRDLAFATDSVTAHQGGSWSFSFDAISTWKNTVETVTSTASELVSTPLAGRTKMIIQNLSSNDIYVGPAGTVTTANGLEVPKGSSFEMGFESDADVHAIAGAGSNSILVSEFAA